MLLMIEMALIPKKKEQQLIIKVNALIRVKLIYNKYSCEILIEFNY